MLPLSALMTSWACPAAARRMEARLANGEEINIAEHGLLCSTLVRIAQRIGINRVPRDVSLTLAEILRENEGDGT